MRISALAGNDGRVTARESQFDPAAGAETARGDVSVLPLIEPHALRDGFLPRMADRASPVDKERRLSRNVAGSVCTVSLHVPGGGDGGEALNERTSTSWRLRGHGVGEGSSPAGRSREIGIKRQRTTPIGSVRGLIGIRGDTKHVRGLVVQATRAPSRRSGAAQNIEPSRCLSRTTSLIFLIASSSRMELRGRGTALILPLLTETLLSDRGFVKELYRVVALTTNRGSAVLAATELAEQELGGASDQRCGAVGPRRRFGCRACGCLISPRALLRCACPRNRAPRRVLLNPDRGAARTCLGQAPGSVSGAGEMPLHGRLLS